MVTSIVCVVDSTLSLDLKYEELEVGRASVAVKKTAKKS